MKLTTTTFVSVDGVMQGVARADAFLFGRRTYEIFAGSWGAMDDPSINPIAVALDTQPKYVASRHSADSAAGAAAWLDVRSAFIGRWWPSSLALAVPPSLWRRIASQVAAPGALC